MKNVLLYIGSFNPPTLGHKKIANILLKLKQFDEVWIQPTYRNTKILLPGYHRIAMLKLLINETTKLKISDLEIKYKMTGSTHSILQLIKKKYPNIQFYIALGSDNIKHIHKWKNYKKLIDEVSFVIVPRIGYPIQTSGEWYNDNKHIILNAEIPKVSSTKLKKVLNNYHESLKYTSHEVYMYIQKHQIKF